MIAQQIKSHIVSSFNDFYSIIVDETLDISKLEQLSFCIRYCSNDLMVHENFLGYFDIPIANAESICEKISCLVTSFKLDDKVMVGQSYDGAATMAGNKTGVAKRLQNKFVEALFVHCHAHRLNLALCDSCSCIAECRDTLHLIQQLYAFVERSGKRHAQFEHLQGTQKRKTTLKSYAPTRWSSHFDALEAVKKVFVEIKTFLMV